jgi:hypothetical protein
VNNRAFRIFLFLSFLGFGGICEGISRASQEDMIAMENRVVHLAKEANVDFEIIELLARRDQGVRINEALFFRNEANVAVIEAVAAESMYDVNALASALSRATMARDGEGNILKEARVENARRGEVVRVNLFEWLERDANLG